MTTVVLRPITPAEGELILSGRRPASGWHPEYPMTDTVIGLRMLTEAHHAAGWNGAGVPTWWIHQVLVDGEVVGDCGFHGPPAGSPTEVELGYNVVPALRGRGVATAACRALLAVAWRDGADVVHADTEPGYAESQRVLAKAGFLPQGDDRFAISRPTGAGPS